MEAHKIVPEVEQHQSHDHQEETAMEKALILGASAMFVLVAASMLTAILIFAVMKIGY